MESKTTQTLLRNHLLHDTDEALLQFVADNAHSILFWSVEHFCQTANISEAKLFAFYEAFGVTSPVAFKSLLRSILYQDMQELRVVKRSIKSITEELIETEIQNLRTLANSMDYSNLDRLTWDLSRASDVLVIGNGGASPYAAYLVSMLTKLGIKAHRMDSLAGFLNSHDTSSLIIAFGIARYSRRSVLQLRTLRQHGFRVVSFTDREDSPWVDLSDYCFLMPLRGFDFVDSYTAGITMINSLLLNIGLQDEEKLVAHLNTYDAVLEDMDIFF